MSDDVSGDMLAPSWPNLFKVIAIKSIHSTIRNNLFSPEFSFSEGSGEGGDLFRKTAPSPLPSMK